VNIDLRIKELILDGLAITPAERPVLQAAVESELARLLAERGLHPALQGSGAQPALRAAGMQLQGGESPAHVGAQIAQAVYEGLGP